MMETVHVTWKDRLWHSTQFSAQCGQSSHVAQSRAWFDFLHVVDNGLQLLVSDFANFIYNPGPTITQVLFLAS